MDWQESDYFGTLKLKNVEATQKFGRDMAQALTPGETLLLKGDLGLGKTTLSQAIIGTLLQEDSPISSPTFNMVHLYDHGTFPIWHVDLYRLDRPEDWQELGLEETAEGLTLIEWPEKAAAFLPSDALGIHLVEENANRAAHLYGNAHWRLKLKHLFPSSEL